MPGHVSERFIGTFLLCDLQMSLRQAYGPGKFGLSFELFPPKTPAGEEDLFRNLAELMSFRPAYVTCTYGAGGSTRNKTLEIVTQVARKFGCSTASHLTCVGSTVEELRAFLLDAQRREVQGIVALRGDPPQGTTAFQAVAGGLSYANQLVELIRDEFPHFDIAVAGYPETHREAPSPEIDLDNLHRKVAAGADLVITQLFYDNHDYFRFVDRCRARGIQQPIVPGILPVTSLPQIRRIAGLCGARLPVSLVQELEAAADNAEAQFEIGVRHAIAQAQELTSRGVPGLHFYVLNKSPATMRILRAMQW